nr:LpqB family beta-propeller domain-containing protein [Anaerolineae bacterium]
LFISYARRDGRDHANTLRTTLESHGFAIWQDVVAMGGGDAWWPQIADAIERAHAVVLILTDGALESPVVRREWVHARRAGTPILPVVFETGVLNRAPNWVKKVDVFILDPTHPDYAHTQRRFLAQIESPVAPAPAVNMTPPLSETAVARPTVQQHLTQRLLSPDLSEPRFGVSVVWGSGGFGKTTAVRAFAGDASVTEVYTGGVLWVTVGETGERLTDSLYAVLDALKRPRPEPSNALRAVRDALDGRDALLVLDDVWEVSLVEPLLNIPQCSVLITTRDASVAKRDDAPIQIDQMTADEATQTLLRHLPDTLTPNAPDRARLHALAVRLGGWPLLLGIFGGTLREEIVTGHHPLADALDYVESGIVEAGLDAFDDTDSGRGKALNQSIDISLRRFSPDEQRRVYELGVLPEDVSAPEATILSLWQGTAQLGGFQAKRLLGRLRGHFVLPDPTGGVRLHDRMREVFQRRMGADALKNAHARLIATWGDPHALPTPYAWRYLGHHLSEGGQADALRALLLDFGWLRAKLGQTDVQSLLSDAARLSADPAIGLLHDALSISAAVLAQDPDALAHQLLGRLIPHRTHPDLRALTDGIGAPAGFILPAYPDSGFPTHDPAGGWVRKILHGHKNSVRCVAYAPDQTLIASGSTDNSILVWDAHNGALRGLLTGHTDVVNSVQFSPDGRWLLSSSSDKTVRVWDARTGAPRKTFNGHSVAVLRAVFTPDGQTVISGSNDRTVRAWHIATDQSHIVYRHSTGVRSIALSPDGQTLVVCAREGKALVIRVSDGALLHALDGHTMTVNRAAFSPDGRLIATGSVDRTVRLWDAQTGAPLRTLTGSFRGITSVQFSPDGQTVLGSNEEKSACLWQVVSGALIRRLEGHSSRIYEACFSPDGQTIVTASNDRLLRVWHVHLTHEPPKTRLHKNGITVVQYQAPDHVLTVAGDDNSAHLWDAHTGTPQADLSGQPVDTEVRRLRPDGAARLILERDSVKIVSTDAEQRHLLTLTLPSDRISKEIYTERLTSAHYLSDGQRVLTSGLDGMAYVWDAQTGDILHTYTGHGALSCAHCAPDGRTVVLAFRDQTLWTWDIVSGHTQRVCFTDAPVWQMAWLGERDVFAAGDGAGRILFLRLIR